MVKSRYARHAYKYKNVVMKIKLLNKLPLDENTKKIINDMFREEMEEKLFDE